MKKLVLIVMLLYPILSYSQSEVSTQTDAGVPKYKHSIGAGAGGVTGLGLSYRRWFDNKAFQITFLPYLSKENSTISLGLTYLKKLKEGRTSDLLFYTGYHFYYDKFMDTSESISKKNISINNNLGAGPGIEIKYGDNIVLDLMFGYAIYHNNEDGLSLNFTGETGIYYNF
ncbi:MAG: hypothetical protein V1833_04530 [Elusimicrobiota bacterium]